MKKVADQKGINLFIRLEEEVILTNRSSLEMSPMPVKPKKVIDAHSEIAQRKKKPWRYFVKWRKSAIILSFCRSTPVLGVWE